MGEIRQDRGKPAGIVVAIVERFLTGPLSILVILLAAALGLMAIVATPREEEPQIVVPMADITVQFPGHSPAEVEHLVTTPLERILWQIQGVEHVYSISGRDMAMVTVRFHVGEHPEHAMTRLRDDIEANQDIVPTGVTGWVIKPVKIDDVPIVTLTLSSPERDGYELRRIGAELKARLAGVTNVSLVAIFGGYRREMRIEPDIEALAARGACFADILAALERNNLVATVGTLYEEGDAAGVLVGPDLASAEEVRNIIISSRDNRIVRLEEVASVTDGAEDPAHYAHVGFGPASRVGRAGERRPAVTLAFSKKKGTNAVTVAREVIAAAEALRDVLIPADVRMIVTRNYGKIANEKVNDLLKSMLFAVITVVVLIAIAMGPREAVVVGLAVPVSFALALFVNYLFGYTINRVTLFALILSLGLVVDDPITNVDNIQRHLRMGLEPPLAATLRGVHEVIPPVVMSTLVIIVCFTPMFFITGMMGPYMGPMAVNVPLAVTFSTLCALTFVPWLSHRLLKNLSPRRPNGAGQQERDVTAAWVRRLYRAVISPFLVKWKGIALLLAVLGLFLASGLLFLFRKVPLKMLPFDNKSELQLVIDMPEGTSVERTDAVAQEFEAYLGTVNEVTDFQTYVGLSAPIDFNGLVRHYALRRGPHQADIRVNLVEKAQRRQQSHAIALRIRDALTEIAERSGAIVKIVEVPPGPPVLATLTVEIGGRADQTYDELIAGAGALKEALAAEDARHIVQIDDMSETPHERYVFDVDRDKTLSLGMSVSDVARELRVAIQGSVPGIVHVKGEREPLRMRVRLPLSDRSRPQRLEQLWGRTPQGRLVQLGELGSFRKETQDQPIMHKDLERVVFVTAECAGRPPGEVVWDMRQRLKRAPLPEGVGAQWAGEGEWQITVRVFRDLGIAFGAALVGIYLLMVVQMHSFLMPLMVMTAIPLTLIGIAPGFFLLNVVAGKEAGGYADPIFFTATAMIGMIALGGIVIRNAIVLIEFIQGALRAGKDIRAAIIDSGAVRFRPIVLTAGTTLLGVWPITLDPVFSGLAWSLIFGLVASTLFTLIVVPTVYMLVGPRDIAHNEEAVP